MRLTQLQLQQRRGARNRQHTALHAAARGVALPKLMQDEWKALRGSRSFEGFPAQRLKRPIAASAMRRADQLPPPTHQRRWGRHESPFSPQWAQAFEVGTSRPNARQGRYGTRRAVGAAPPPPFTDMQALMEAPPNVEPQQSTASLLPVRERIAEAVELLPERLRWVFEGRHYRGMSVRQMAMEIQVSKTHVHRLYVQAVELLREALAEEI